MENPKTLAIVMAGGQSPNLWPKSTFAIPKQFLHFVGEHTLLQNTVERISHLFPLEKIYVVTGAEYENIVKEQLPSLPVKNIVLEPFARNTLPCVSLALTQLIKEVSDETVCVIFPSDHHISNFGEFFTAIETAADFAKIKDAIVTIGVSPSRPETNYGYIQVDVHKRDLGDYYYKGIRYTKTFAEKPDFETAKRFISTNEFLWNTGIFILRVSTFWNSLRNCSPEIYNYFNILKKLVDRPNFAQAVDETYRQIQSISIDTGIMELAPNVFVLESNFSWSDVGTWEEIYRLSLKDAQNNHLVGDVIAIETNNCLIQTHEKLIATIGIDDLVIVDTPKALLVCKRQDSHKVIEIVNYLRRKNASTFL
ncbi:MAG: sugar phosphate nucleotidyltransferase [Ignavibacteria bacterium]|nr:sugar phosphate nucleotidyltransferase [Ignavibacteria bacterium]